MNVKTPLDLFRPLFKDLEILTDVSLHRDLDTITHRVEHEGLPFLTQTLPSFGDWFFLSLKTDTIQCHPSFRRRVALPVFLHGLTSRVFDENTGNLLGDPCYVAAYAVRQICYLLYKYEVTPTPEAIASAFHDVIEIDRELDGTVVIDPFDKVFLVAESLVDELFENVCWQDIIPKHGPGATNLGLIDPWVKYSHLHAFTDVYDETFMVPSPAYFSVDQIDNEDIFDGNNTSLPKLRESKVSAVPKTAKGPRIISAESPELMWLQLGIGQKIADVLDHHPLSKGLFNFSDQSVNGKLALDGSLTGAVATLDMSSASDRVSRKLCAQLLPSAMFRALDEIRSTHTLFPAVKEVNFKSLSLPLSKMAPMGNGFCFPLESLVFWSLAVSSIAVSMNGVITSDRVLRDAAKLVHTYGDDLIVPSKYAGTVMSDLERYGFVFNAKKSYWSGPFRESCGIDAFLGVDITPHRVKKVIPYGQENVDSIVGWLDLANNCRPLLPNLAKALSDTAYAALGHTPIHPENWDGFLGKGKPFQELKGKDVQAGDILKRGAVKWEIPGGAVLETPHLLAPSDGKVTKVLFQAPRVVRPDDGQFSETHRYLRALCKAPSNRSWKDLFTQVEDTSAFSVRNTTVLVYKKVFVA